jgi:D-xylose transport system substrate-binding protein
MKQSKLIACFGLTFLMVLAGCSKKADTVKGIKDIRIGVSVGSIQEERWQREIQMFRDYAKEKGFELLVQSAEGNAQKQISQCENLISQGIDVLIVQSVDAFAMTPIIDTAHSEGIKVIAYGHFAMNCDLDYYCSFDEVKVGVRIAEFVIGRANKGNFVFLKGKEEDNNSHRTASGARSVLQPYVDSGDIKIVMEQWVRGMDPSESLRLVENALNMTNNNIQGIISPNDGTAGGAIQATLAQGLNIPTAGQDADLAACQRIVSGLQAGTVYKPLAKLNRACMELAVAIALGQDVDTAIDPSFGYWTTVNNLQKEVKTFSIDVLTVDQSNLYDFLIAQEKFHKLEDVYRDIPRDQWPDRM